MKHPIFITLASLAAGTLHVLSADWPQWQGPDRNAVSKETGLLQEWPKEGPPLAWTMKGLGGGYGAPSIAAGRMFGMSNRAEDEVVWARSEKDGKELWVTRLGKALTEGMPQGKEGAGCTPTVDGDRLYVLGLGGDLACLQVADGKILWQSSLVKDFGGEVPAWRYNESPLIDGDKLICTPGGKEATLVALDKMTGKTIWKSALPASSNSEPTAPAAPGGGGGRGGRGNIGGFSIASNVGPQMFTQADANKDQKLSRAEFTALADTWFDKLDPEKAGKVTAAQFAERFYDAVPRAQNASGPDAPDQQQRRPSRSTAPAFMTAADNDNDGSLTRVELKDTFTKWYDQWDAEKSGALTDEKFRTGLNAALPAPQFGGGGGSGGGGRGRGFGNLGNSGAAYSSAISIDFEGQRQYVQFTSKALIGVGADGKFLWRFDRPVNGMGIHCTTPLYRDGMIFSTSAYGAGGALAKLIKDGSGGIKAEEVWFSRDMENHHGGVVVVDGALYGANGGNGGGYLACLDFKTGETLWNERDSDKRRVRKGSLTLADGRIYYRTEEGAVVLIEPNPREYVERGRFEQPDRTRSPAWTHPVIANGKLYIRDQDTLYCYDIRKKQ
jgi:alcohol dehydrogenase (cytochrome c)